MVTHTSDTAKVYALTAAGACSVTLTQGDHSVTWQALREAGQTTVLVPAGAALSLSDEGALLSPMPFKAALGTGNGSAGGAEQHAAGEPLSEPVVTDTSAAAMMRHNTWCRIPADVLSVTITAEMEEQKAQCMQLLLCPAADLPLGWLSAEHAVLTWPFGEPVLVQGFAYVVTLVLIPFEGHAKLIANLSPLGAV